MQQGKWGFVGVSAEGLDEIGLGSCSVIACRLMATKGIKRMRQDRPLLSSSEGPDGIEPRFYMAGKSRKGGRVSRTSSGCGKEFLLDWTPAALPL
ncbi:hypothetical protein MA16_Dca006658 [Dendrobium catenatum]|uniref:Uncharacterized protein n=1 Tax=Dendrobium catenatum TaxID=906689 RepID=A0A2I0X5T1_9ASPA|nr:hypothetical protein MA16_Dca006658 [Dendrobium catenatum]